MTDTVTPVTLTAAAPAPVLPAQFAELAPFTGWIFETWRPRYEKRLASSMDEMQAFYDAILPRIADIIEYCDGFPFDDLPDDARNVLLLTFAFCEASFPVEAWRQPRVPDSGAADIMLVSEPIL